MSNKPKFGKSENVVLSVVACVLAVIWGVFYLMDYTNGIPQNEFNTLLFFAIITSGFALLFGSGLLILIRLTKVELQKAQEAKASRSK